MKNNICLASMALLFMMMVSAIPAQTKEEGINDILINPARYWNMQVTLIGEVQRVNADPAGTTRGTYTLLDDSCPKVISIRTRDLPPVGRAFRVTGIVLQDPNNAAIPVIKELERAAVGEFSSSTRNLLLGLGVVLIILIVVFVFLLLKPRKSAASQSRTKAVIMPETRNESRNGTVVIQDAVLPIPEAQGGETQLLPTMIAELLVERGSDKGVKFTISKNENAIGRSGKRLNDIVLTDNTVSKEQASLHFDPVNNQFTIINQSGKNQTKANGIIVEKPLLLKDGDLIEMGKTALRFKIK